MEKEIINQKKYRNILANIICENISMFDESDLLCEFETNLEVSKKLDKYKGDIYSNPIIEKFDDDAYKLIEMTLRNIQRFVKKNLPLWIISQKDGKVSA